MMKHPNETALGERCFICKVGKCRILDVFEDGLHQVVHCTFCRQETIVPPPTLQDIKDYYQDYGTSKFSDRDFRFLFVHSLRYFEHFFQLCGSSRQWQGTNFLEIGFGQGASLLAAACSGLQASGIDLDAECISRLEQRTIEYDLAVNLYCGEITDLPSRLSFDVIKASQVIEHTLDPRKFLDEIAKRQTQGGYLLLECPNNEGAFWYVKNRLRKKYDRMNFYKSLKLTEHLWGFTKKSLALLLQETGYEVVYCHDYYLRDERFHHENLLHYPTLSEGVKRSFEAKNSYHFLKSLIPPFDLVASKVARQGTHLAVCARRI
jgi:2-polyprenyl-3-methyl-5-hydroxy-6-metoxy-1,4-benzoquinol methylase